MVDVEVEVGLETDVGVDVDEGPQVCVSAHECGLEEGTNYQGICGADGVCGYEVGVCGASFVDVDGDSENGCECEITDLNDVPDLERVDSNCDGVDGILEGDDANVVFVSVGTESSGGELQGLRPDVPVGSIAAGIELAAEVGRSFVLVSGGDYYGPLKLESGISIYGGYDSQNGWKRDVRVNETRIVAGSKSGDEGELSISKMVSADGLTEQTIVDGLTIVGSTVSEAGASTYAVWAFQSEKFVVQNSKIVAGDAGQGQDGKPKKAPQCIVSGGEVAMVVSGDMEQVVMAVIP